MKMSCKTILFFLLAAFVLFADETHGFALKAASFLPLSKRLSPKPALFGGTGTALHLAENKEELGHLEPIPPPRDDLGQEVPGIEDVKPIPDYTREPDVQPLGDPDVPGINKGAASW